MRKYVVVGLLALAACSTGGGSLDVGSQGSGGGSTAAGPRTDDGGVPDPIVSTGAESSRIHISDSGLITIPLPEGSTGQDGPFVFPPTWQLPDPDADRYLPIGSETFGRPYAETCGEGGNCIVDADCGSGAICGCTGPSHEPREGFCRAAECATNDDCANGLCVNHESVDMRDCSGADSKYRCTDDTVDHCREINDCNSDAMAVCALDTAKGYRVCNSECFPLVGR